MEFELFLSLLRALPSADVYYVLVGGVAVNLHGVVRATEDIDLFVRLDDANIERLKAALLRVWDDPERLSKNCSDSPRGPVRGRARDISERQQRQSNDCCSRSEITTFSARDFNEDCSTLRNAPPGTGLVIDIITRIGTKVAFDEREHQVIEVGGAVARVATIATAGADERRHVEADRSGRRRGFGHPTAPPGDSSRGAASMTPIERFKSFGDAREALWMAPGDPRLIAKIRQVWAFGQGLARYPAPRGLWFFRDMDEANAHRAACTAERVKRLSDERGRPLLGVDSPPSEVTVPGPIGLGWVRRESWRVQAEACRSANGASFP